MPIALWVDVWRFTPKKLFISDQVTNENESSGTLWISCELNSVRILPFLRKYYLKYLGWKLDHFDVTLVYDDEQVQAHKVISWFEVHSSVFAKVHSE